MADDYAPVLDYIAAYWPRITRYNPKSRGTLIGLPRPYLVPHDGPQAQDLFYWDSYFMALGVAGTRYEPLVGDLAENLAALLRRFGLIPNASRYYYLSRSQPPVFVELIWLAYRIKQAADPAAAPAFLRRMMALAELEHTTVWLGTRAPHHRLVHAGLSRYYDVSGFDGLAERESGWDHTPRCAGRWLEHLPVDLNAILYMNERSFARAATLLGQQARAQRWEAWAAERATTMQRLLWDDALGTFCDYDYITKQRNVQQSLAAFFPLWAGLATPAQAARLVSEALPRFLAPGGLATTPDAHPAGQWAYPYGWAPLQWIVVAGLERYGYLAEARRIMRAWCDNCAAVFAATGTMWAKYNVAAVGALDGGGLDGTLSGFGWSNAVFADFARRLARPPQVTVVLPGLLDLPPAAGRSFDWTQESPA